jgi:hypothetical protein
MIVRPNGVLERFTLHGVLFAKKDKITDVIFALCPGTLALAAVPQSQTAVTSESVPIAVMTVRTAARRFRWFLSIIYQPL